MGMDIVKRIGPTELGGELTLRDEPGPGRHLHAAGAAHHHHHRRVLVQCAAQAFVVPVSSIEEIIEIDPRNKSRGPTPGASLGAFLYERRGEALTLFELDALLCLPRTEATAVQGLVVRRKGEALAFQIDRIFGQKEVMVRPIEDPLGRARGVAGATDLGDGRPTLVLDLDLCSGLYPGSTPGRIAAAPARVGASSEVRP